MKPCLNYCEGVIGSGPGNAINEAMFAGDSPRPVAGKIPFQGLRLTNSFKRLSLYFFNKIIYLL